jgi:hypothetical protein
MPDLTASDLDAAVRTIAGSARSMGVTWRVSEWRISKRAKAVSAKVDRTKAYPLDEAIALVKSNAPRQVQ